MLRLLAAIAILIPMGAQAHVITVEGKVTMGMGRDWLGSITNDHITLWFGANTQDGEKALACEGANVPCVLKVTLDPQGYVAKVLSAHKTKAP